MWVPDVHSQVGDSRTSSENSGTVWQTQICTWTYGQLDSLAPTYLSFFLFLNRYMCSLSLFHYSEYLVTAVNNPKSLSLDSFLLNHSLEYTVAALSSWIEFTLENIFWPGQCVPRFPLEGRRVASVQA